eukprot:3179253-Rhodomonas_salina.1
MLWHTGIGHATSSLHVAFESRGIGTSCLARARLWPALFFLAQRQQRQQRPRVRALQRLPRPHRPVQ